MNILNALIYPAAALLLVGLGYAFGLDSADKRLAKVRAIAARRKLRLRAQREEIRWYQRHWAPDTDDERPETPYEPRRHKTDEPEPQTETTARDRFAVLGAMRNELVRANAEQVIASDGGWGLLSVLHGGHDEQHDDSDLPLFRDTTDALTGLTAAYRVLCETEMPGTSATWPGSGDTAIPKRGGEDEMPTPLTPTKPVAAAIAMRQIAHAPKVGV